jgi:hypothetical protein
MRTNAVDASTKRQRGTYQRCRDDHRRTVPDVSGTPIPPYWLSREAREIFEDLAEQLTRVGLVAEADTTLLANVASLAAAIEKVWATGEIPAASQLAELRRCLEMIGAAGSRSRVGARPVPPVVSLEGNRFAQHRDELAERRRKRTGGGG